MENAYLTIKEAIAHTGRSEETIRRWVRSTRAQFLVELSDTNQELEQKTPLLRKQNELQPDGAIRRDRNGLPVFDWLLQRVALEESFREEGAPPHATPADDPKLSIEGTNDDTQPSGEDTDDSPQTENKDTPKKVGPGAHDDTQPSGEDTDDSPQTEYIRVHREVYRDLIGQLGTKDKQIARKDTQLDNTIQRNGELNVLLQGYQKRLGALPPPTDIREHVTGETEEEPTTNAL